MSNVIERQQRFPHGSLAATRLIQTAYNFERLPLFYLGKKLRPSFPEITLTTMDNLVLDMVSIRVETHPRYGYLGPLDYDVKTVLERIQFTANHSQPGPFQFTVADIIRHLPPSHHTHAPNEIAGGRRYSRIKLAINRLRWVKIMAEASRVLFDRPPEGESQPFTFLSDLKARQTTAPGGFPTTIYSARWHTIIEEQLAANRTRPIDYEFYKSLRFLMSRRLYRLLTALTDPDGRVPPMPLSRLARMLPLLQSKPAHLLRLLDKAHKELKAAGFLRTMALDTNDNSPVGIRYDIASQRIPIYGCQEADQLVAELEEALQDDHSTPFFRHAVSLLPASVIREALYEATSLQDRSKLRRSAAAAFNFHLKKICQRQGLPFPWGATPLPPAG